MSRLLDDYARHHGYDPSKGPWVLIVYADGTTYFETFENEDNMWCCKQPERVAEIVGRIRADHDAGIRGTLPQVELTFDPADLSTYMQVAKK